MLRSRIPTRLSVLALAALAPLVLGHSRVLANRVQPGNPAGIAAQAAAAGGAPFQGFGVSGAWWARDTGSMPAPARSHIAGLLFTRGGLGLTMYRYNIGGGGKIKDTSRWAPGYLRQDGSYDWSADRAGRDMLKRAAALGVQQLVGFANAAPPQFTTNGLGCGGELRPDRVSQYAAYLAQVIAHFEAAGIHVSLVSPMNEPDSTFAACNQEGMKVPVSLRAPLIQAVQAALSGAGSSADVIADESSGTGDLLHKAPSWLAGDGGGTAHPAAIAYHAYDAPDDAHLQAVGSLAGRASSQPFMSEVCCMVNGKFARGFRPGMTSGLWLAHAIWRNLTLAGASSFSWWVALSPELGCDARSSSCGTSANGNGWDDGLIYYDRDYRSDGNLRLVLTKRYWVYSQFSRWIDPGMRPHAVSGAPAGAQVLVYSGNGRTVVVATAPPAATGTTTFSLHLPWLGSARAMVYSTSETRNAGPLPAVPATGGVLPVSMAPGSVTTYVLPG